MQPAASYLSMGDSSAREVGQEGLATLNVPAIELSLVAPLLKESRDVFCNPVFSPDMHIIHDIDLTNPMTQPLKPK